MASTKKTDARVDGYLDAVAPFATPILIRLRGLVHKACPEIEETMKWSRPFFVHHGAILCNMSAFKEHCSFGFWVTEIGDALREAGVWKDGASGSLGRITSVKDLPPDAVMVELIQKAAAFVDGGGAVSKLAASRAEKKGAARKAVKPPVEVPEDLAAMLGKNKRAAAVFAGFSPSCKREYTEWIAEAKRAETREKRIATAVEWIAEGKERNWKYQ